MIARYRSRPPFHLAFQYIPALCLVVGASGETALAQTSIAFVQANYATPQSPQSLVNVPFTAAQSTGNLNVVVVGWNDTVAQVQSVVDSQGNLLRASGWSHSPNRSFPLFQPRTE